MRISSHLLLGLAVLTLCESVVSGKIHASVLNHLGGGKSINVHCQSKDTDLGQQTVADGGQFGWDFSVNVIGSTLFYCDLNWENFSGFHFDAYSFKRDWRRCATKCLWMVSKEGMYGLNDQTGFWEFMYSWPNCHM